MQPGSRKQLGGPIPCLRLCIAEFDDYLHSAVTAESPTEREAKLEAWSSAPHARYCHPREEHLVRCCDVSQITWWLQNLHSARRADQMAVS